MKQLHTSVLIVGSGAAGQRCAIELREQGQEDILIVGDRKFTDPHTTQARGGINAALHTMDTEDTPLVHAVDTFREGQYVAHPDLVELLADHAPSAIDDLVRRGADFHKEDDGRLTQRFFGAHSYRRTVFSGDETGLEMIKTLSRRSGELGIPYLQDTYVYELLVENNIVQGVLAIDKKTDEHMHIVAPLVVFATGGFSNVYRRSSSRNKENFGDGIGIAYRAGAMIGDVELIQFHPTGLMYPEEKFGELVTEAVRGEGGKLFNADGERFMDKYDPQKMELSTRDVVARANFQEIREGRGTPNGGVWLDISHRSKAYILERLPKMHSMILKYNQVDISQAPVEVAPTTHYTMGGIRFDPKTLKTTIENFFVAGECTMGVHGANRLGGNSLMETMVFGKLVAQVVLQQSPSAPLSQGDSQYEFLLHDDGLDGEKVLIEVRKKMGELAGIVRVEEELLELQRYLTSVEKEIQARGLLPQDTGFDSIMMCNRVRTVLELGQLITLGALERKESRGAHYRTDALAMSDEFNKNYMHQQQDGTLVSTWKEVPTASQRLQKGLETREDEQRLKNYTHSE